MTEEERKALEDQLNAKANDMYNDINEDLHENLKDDLQARIKAAEEDLFRDMPPEMAKDIKQAIDMHMCIVEVLVRDGDITPFKAGFLAIKITTALSNYLSGLSSQE